MSRTSIALLVILYINSYGSAVGSVNIMAKQIEYPADTVDAAGNVWPTVGENIRNGANLNRATINSIIQDFFNQLFPVGFQLGIGDFPSFLNTFQVWAPPPLRTTTDLTVGYFGSDSKSTIHSEYYVLNMSKPEWDSFSKIVPDVRASHLISCAFKTRIA